MVVRNEILWGNMLFVMMIFVIMVIRIVSGIGFFMFVNLR